MSETFEDLKFIVTLSFVVLCGSGLQALFH